MSHVTHMNESCHTYEIVNIEIKLQECSIHTTPHAAWRSWMSHVTHMNESCHTYECVMSHVYEWVMSHIWMSRITRMNESYHTYGWVMSHIWMSHVRHTNESYHTYELVTLHVWSSQRRDETPGISQITPREARVSWMTQATDMDVSCHTCKWVMSHERMRSDPMHSYVRHDSFVRETCLMWRGGGLGSRPKKMYGERLGDGVEYHLMSPTPRR